MLQAGEAEGAGPKEKHSLKCLKKKIARQPEKWPEAEWSEDMWSGY